MSLINYVLRFQVLCANNFLYEQLFVKGGEETRKE